MRVAAIAGGSGIQERQTFSTRAAARILAVSPDRIRYWVKRRLVAPSAARGRRYRFDFNDLLLMRMAKELLPRRRRLGAFKRCVERARGQTSPARPTPALKLHNDDGRIVMREGAALFEIDTGQLLLRFGAPRAAGTVEHRFGPARVHERFEEARRLAESDPLRALKLHSEFLGREPRDFAAHTRMAALLEGAGDLTGALRHLLGAAVLAPANAEVNLRLGALYRRREDVENALQCFERAAQCDPLSIEAHRNLAELYESAGRRRDAERHLVTLDHLCRGGG